MNPLFFYHMAYGEMGLASRIECKQFTRIAENGDVHLPKKKGNLVALTTWLSCAPMNL